MHLSEIDYSSEGVTKIGNRAFNNCTSLKYLALPSTLTTIDSYAFDNDRIEKVEIKDLNKYLRIKFPTRGCNPIHNGGDLYLNGELVTSVTFPDGMKDIQAYALQGFRSLQTVVLPASVKTIGEQAFDNCPNLANVTMGDAVETIGNGAFQSCQKLASIKLSDALKSINYACFNGCENLESVTMGYAVETIGDFAFNSCKNLASTRLSESLKSIGVCAFNGCENLESVTMGNAIETIGDGAFQSCKKLASFVIPEKVTVIPDDCFYDCYSLETLSIPASVERIGNRALNNLNSLKSLRFEDSENPIQLGYSDPWGSGSVLNNSPLLESMYIGRNINFGTSYYGNLDSFRDLNSLKSLTFGNLVTIIPDYAFTSCRSLENIEFGERLSHIGVEAFRGCQLISLLEVPQFVTRIGDRAFDGTNVIMTFYNNVPSELGENAFSTANLLRVPDLFYERYCTDWNDYKNQIVSVLTPTDYDVTVEAKAVGSGVEDAVKTTGVNRAVVNLKVSGTINSYDIMVMRNKMLNLRHLDLSDATIVANNYEHYQGHHSDDNVVGTNFFSGLSGLRSVILPNSALRIAYSACRDCENLNSVTIGENTVEIGSDAFHNNGNLKEVKFGKSIDKIGWGAFRYCYNLQDPVFNNALTRIEGEAFYECNSLKDIVLPDYIKYLGDRSFYGCDNLETIKFPRYLKRIDYEAFRYCYRLKEVMLPTTLQEIGSYAFSDCNALTAVKIPSSVMTIGDYAFYTNSINDVYTWTIEPTFINQNTFTQGVYLNSTLHVPETSSYLYYWNTQWSQFQEIVEFNLPYEYFYLANNDLTEGEDTPRIEGENGDNPDADINAGGGLIVNGDESQDLGDVNINGDGNNAGSIIGGNSETETSGANVNIDNLKIQINITGNKWYFFAFPFDIPYGNIHFNGKFVWRYYDGEYRAEHGSGAWKDHEGTLVAGRGYIFQANKNGTLTLNVGAVSIGADDQMIALESYASENAANASWNLMGNPYTSYYELAALGYNSPITIWNGDTRTYEAYNPQDDDLTIYPFQAFFVQKPEGVDEVVFEAEGRETENMANEGTVQQSARRKRYARARAQQSTPRYLINLEISDGESKDRTRVVFNESKTESYDIECDASKFLSSEVAQIYSLDNNDVKYSINERPMGNGIVRLGITTPASGNYSISATRMDHPVMLMDVKEGTVNSLDMAYHFDAGAGADNDRFLLVQNGTTGVDGINIEEMLNNGSAIYVGTDGFVYGDYDKAPSGVLIKVEGRKAEKIIK